MTLGGLFEGIGGFPLAATRAGINPIWSNEINHYCCKVLRNNFEHEIIESDIRDIGRQNLTPVDIVSGGFPCQPFSHAGRRKGEADNRFLWPEMLRVIREMEPSWVVAENVAGLVSMDDGKTLERILTDLEAEAYTTESYLIPASAVGAWHKRERLWIVAYRDKLNGDLSGLRTGQVSQQQKAGIQDDSDSNRKRLPESSRGKFGSVQSPIFTPQGCELSGAFAEKRNYWSTEPELGRVANGIPSRMDRIKALGNAVVPQIAYEIFKAIKTRT